MKSLLVLVSLMFAVSVFAADREQFNVGKLYLNGTEVTATAAELNSLHTAAATSNDLAKLHAVTASALELNALDNTCTSNDLVKLSGVTATALELNALDNTCTSNDLVKLNGITGTVAQINGLLSSTITRVVTNSSTLSTNIMSFNAYGRMVSVTVDP